MKTVSNHHSGIRQTAGFTLIEMSSAMSVMMVLAVALIVMLQQHVQFMQMFQQQSFLTDEAPKVGNLLGRMINQADHYFVYANKAEALGGGAPILTSGRAVRLFFKSAAQETAERLITMETPASGGELRFYSWLADGTSSSWVISSRLSDVGFVSDQGILSMTLQGPNGERVTFGGGVK